ncbi:phosphoribosylformylglycinamidine synthase subunit PurS [Campylobacter sp.]|uniref:phosphoribosylformylglycinamidine synthase subunit PurS n=1 Tax=Campylobacter sp. TaxID=205 RepID=UPI0026DC3688|nr:phosphoribosylformylglycinamidine synthase subunit PurS [Campylobacter sp.]MDO4674490.1 phosphoribosylformylglycinamidine synthase subunit PurS [Campylobacter sp.]
MRVILNVFLKDGVLDPQGKAVEKALHALNFKQVQEVKVAKQIQLTLSEEDRDRAQIAVQKMCEELLVNKVIEDFEILF